MSESQPNVLLFGPPGAGKGTQSVNVAEEYDVPHITTGDALRANKDMETEYGTPREFMEAGELVPDPVVNEIVAEALSGGEGYVLDGYPRNTEQAKYLADITALDVVCLLAVSESEIIKRLTGRRVCKECGANYHVEFNPPKEEGVCDECGGELIQREDDTEDTVKERIRVYHESTEPMVEYYREAGVLEEIDGDGTPEEVWAELRETIDAAI
ncbi:MULTISPECIES: adenylate kinase [unclassified Haloferax]|jgi:adenylate kinase|uniref:adenylate kinase n=1 Tax=unclassified Haloferax TaxID=2625095 RepID=UPI002876A774|nr:MULTISPECIES: adenylate kinase [unclassified Haloferax]MDS0243884.1 adenylate kinase [Haloferax sp. S2CR25]MDS0447005.1 adenylate kinase [Haloferax sp. S2CR25-2]